MREWFQWLPWGGKGTDIFQNEVYRPQGTDKPKIFKWFPKHRERKKETL